jgi:Tfp pilus assembly protein PilF
MSSLVRIAVLVALLCALVYANALYNGFVYDDWDLVVHNRWLREGPITEAFTRGFWASSRGGSFYYRPVVSLSYRLDQAIWGVRPFGYHLTNILLHAATSILVLILASRWLSSLRAAAAAAALFAVHPVHTQSVTWIAGRTDLLATVFLLMALALIHRGVGPAGTRAPRSGPPPPPSPTLLAAGLLFLALALLSKEMAVTFPALLALHAWFVTREGGFASRRSRMRPWLPPLAASAIVVAAWLLLRMAVVGSAAGFADDPHAWWHPAEGSASRLMAIPLIAAFYIGRILLPLWLGFESGIEPAGGLLRPMSWIAAAGVALTILFAYRMRRRQPAVPFGIAWALVALLPVLNIFPIFESAMEHFAYLPSVGLILAATAAGAALIRMPEVKVAALVILVVLLGGRTMARNGDWRDEESFWRITTRDTPSARAWNNLGLHLRERGDLEGASEALGEVLRLRPDLASSHSNLGVLDAAAGRRTLAIRRFNEALAIDPVNADALYNLALVLESNELGERYGTGFPADEALAAYRRLLEAHPGHAEGWTNIGVLHEVLGRHDEASAAWERAIAAAPTLPEPRLFLADALWDRGERGRAAKLYARYLELETREGPDPVRARERTGPSL